MAGAYAGALAFVAGLFVAYRVHVHHATFAGRAFFWVGNLHRDATMGFRMRERRTGFAVLNEGLHDRARQIPVRTDAWGLRIPMDADSAGAAPGGIAAIGCSCTFAHGVAAESSYVYQAARLLGLPPSNLGVCAYSSVTSLLLLEEQIDRLRPRVVVYGFGNFHLERSVRPHADSDLFQSYVAYHNGACRIEPPLFDNRRVFETAPAVERLYYEPRIAGDATPQSLGRIAALLPLSTQDLSRALHPATLKLRFALPPPPDSSLCRFVLQRLYDDCHSRSTEFVLLWFPKEFGDRPAPGMVTAVDALRNRDGFTFVDCSPGLFAAVKDQQEYAARWQVPRDGHPNRFMHLEMGRAVAAAVAPRLGIALPSEMSTTASTP